MLALLGQTLKNNHFDGNTSVYYTEDTTDPTKSTWKLGSPSPLHRFCAWVKGNTPDEVSRKQLDSTATRQEFIKELNSKYGKTIVDEVLQNNGIIHNDATPLKVRHVSAVTAGCKTLSEKSYAALNQTIKEKIEKKDGLVACTMQKALSGKVSKEITTLFSQPDFKASLRDHFDNLLERKKAEAACSTKGSVAYIGELAHNQNGIFDKLMEEAVEACFESRKNALDASFPKITTYVPNIQYSSDPIGMIKAHLADLANKHKMHKVTTTFLSTLLDDHQNFIEKSTTPVCTLGEIVNKITSVRDKPRVIRVQ